MTALHPNSHWAVDYTYSGFHTSAGINLMLYVVMDQYSGLLHAEYCRPGQDMTNALLSAMQAPRSYKPCTGVPHNLIFSHHLSYQLTANRALSLLINCLGINLVRTSPIIRRSKDEIERVFHRLAAHEGDIRFDFPDKHYPASILCYLLNKALIPVVDQWNSTSRDGAQAPLDAWKTISPEQLREINEDGTPKGWRK